MTSRTKEILRECLFIYHVTPNKQPLIDKVKENLSIHYNSIKNIGVGLDDDKVRAGEIFLRIYNK